jgi:hypothetical protein
VVAEVVAHCIYIEPAAVAAVLITFFVVVVQADTTSTKVFVLSLAYTMSIVMTVVAVRPAPPRASSTETTTTIGLQSPRRAGGHCGRGRRHPAAHATTANAAAGDVVCPGSTIVAAMMMRRPDVHLLAAPSRPTIDHIAVSLSHRLLFTRSLIYVESNDYWMEIRIATLSALN